MVIVSLKGMSDVYYLQSYLVSWAKYLRYL
jgi:hypothetical protein